MILLLLLLFIILFIILFFNIQKTISIKVNNKFYLVNNDKNKYYAAFILDDLN